MLKSYIAFHVETTGLNPMENEIIEIGALKVRDGKVAERFMEFIHPTAPISAAITNLTGRDVKWSLIFSISARMTFSSATTFLLTTVL